MGGGTYYGSVEYGVNRTLPCSHAERGNKDLAVLDRYRVYPVAGIPPTQVGIREARVTNGYP